MGQKQKTGKEKRRDRLNDGNNNGQLRIVNATSGGARKAAWAKIPEGLGIGPDSATERWA